MSVPSFVAAVVLASLATAQDRFVAEIPAVQTASGPVDVVAEAGENWVRNASGDADASVYSFSYSAGQDPDRPVVFFWNGGPGGSTSLLHLGFGAPFRAKMSVESDGSLGPNPHTLVDVADVVYVDAIGTGFSRALRGEDSDFWGVRSDAMVSARFVEAFLAERGREGAPVYLAGESYGGVRIAAMAEPLLDAGVDLRGLLMISPAIDSAVIVSGFDDDLRLIDRVPSLAALAVDQGWREPRDPEAFIESAYQFATDVHLPALRLGDRLDPEVADGLADMLEAYTGQDAEEIRERGLRLSRAELAESLGLRDSRLIDRYDARFTNEGDSLAGVEMAVLRRSLKTLLDDVWDLDTGGKYVIQNSRANRRWRMPAGTRGLSGERVDITAWVAEACERAGVRLLVTGGRFDLVTPSATARRMHEQGSFGTCDVELREYDGGHVIYADEEAHELMVADVRAWLMDRRPEPGS